MTQATSDIASPVTVDVDNNRTTGIDLSLPRWQPTILYLTCFSLLVFASLIAAHLVKPAWNAPGYPAYIHYGKNIEAAAVRLTLLAIGVICALRSRLKPAVGISLFVVAYGVIMRYYAADGLMLIPMLLLGFAIYFTWFDQQRTPLPPDAGIDTHSVRTHVSTALLALAGAAWFSASALRPLQAIDLHHNGEVITGAIDLLTGGIPYKTFYMPHGLSDSGVVAVIIALTGDRGVGSIVLLQAIEAGIGFVALFLTALGLIRRQRLAFAAAFVIAMLLGSRLGEWSFYLFPVLALLVVSTSSTKTTSLIASGVLLGVGHIWRIETAVFGFAAVILCLIVDRYYVEGRSIDRQTLDRLRDLSKLMQLVLNIGCVLAGVIGSLALSRLILGFPTMAWYRSTLIEMPRYHVDSTGLPFPIAWGTIPLHTLLQLYVAPIIACLFIGAFAFGLSKLLGGRFALSLPGERFFFGLLLYGLVSLRTALDRSDNVHLFESVFVLGLVLILDAIRAACVPPGRSGTGLETGRLFAIAGGLFVALCFAEVSDLAYPDHGTNYLGVPAASAITVFNSCMRPTRTTADFVTPSTDPDRAALKAGIDQVKAILSENHVGPKQLLVYHSAAFLYPALGYRLPTKYYELGWAATPAMEQDLIGELKRAHIRAFLHAKGFRALYIYDVPDSFRIPSAHAYISYSEAQGQVYQTGLGVLTIIPQDSSVPEGRSSDSSRGIHSGVPTSAITFRTSAAQ